MLNRSKSWFGKFKKALYILFLISIVFLFVMWIFINHLRNKDTVDSFDEYSAVVSETIPISYNDFLTKIKDNKVDRVIYDAQAPDIEIIDNEESHYRVSNPRTDNFKEFLLKNDIGVEDVTPSSYDDTNGIPIILAFLIVGGIFVFLLKKPSAQGIGASSKVKSINVAVNKPSVCFNDIAGYETTKRDVQYLIDFLKNPEKYKMIGARMPKGIIFYGPPGTGKTLCAKAIAGEAGVPFFYASGSDFVEMYVGVGAKRVRELFEQAKKSAPCIVFIDEIDGVGKKRGHDNNGEIDQTINALLTELDGFTPNEGVIVVGATNRLDILDDALIRPGRFDRHIAIPLPDLKERIAILNLTAKNLKLSSEVDLEKVAKETIGFSGAGLDTLLNESAILAVINNRDEITYQDIDDALFKVIMKGDKKSLEDVKEDQIRLVAWHEAGHALTAKLLSKKTVSKITIVPSTSGAGGVTFISPEEAFLYSQQDLINEIKICYGGRIAEYLLSGKEELTTTGASEDIKQATRILISMIRELGMTEEVGLLNIQEFQGVIETQVLELAKIMSKRFYTEALSLLNEKRSTLEQIALRLIEKETIEEPELDEIIFNDLCIV
jgi:cell division protease FtsH